MGLTEQAQLYGVKCRPDGETDRAYELNEYRQPLQGDQDRLYFRYFDDLVAEIKRRKAELEAQGVEVNSASIALGSGAFVFLEEIDRLKKVRGKKDEPAVDAVFRRGAAALPE